MLRRLTQRTAPLTAHVRHAVEQVGLRVIGLSAFVAAGFSVSPTAGWATLGAGALLLEFSLEPDDQPSR